MLFHIKNLKKTYNNRTVLDLPELNIETNKIYGILGPNGSGKTTLLSILSFLNSPSEGEVFYRGSPVIFSEKHLQTLRREVVLVDQHPIMFSTSVYKNIEFALKIRKIPVNDRPAIISKVLEQVGMENFINADARKLSGGETQRVAIARALACCPKVIIFDEPTASVDMSSQLAIENIICELHKKHGISIIMSTHNMLQASGLVHEKIFLLDGLAGYFTYENIFTGKAVSENSRHFCLINNNLLIPVKTRQTGNIKISVNPRLIKIFLSKPANVTGKIYKGEIIRLTLENEKIRILADIGIPLNILIEKQEYKNLGFCVGDNIFINLVNNSIKII